MALKLAGLLLVMAAWALLLWGLFVLPSSNDPAVDLDAGPSFAVNFDIYLPATVLTALLLVALPFVVAYRRGDIIGFAVCLVMAAFAVRVLSYRPLIDYIPDLTNALRWAVGLIVASLIAFVLEMSLPVADNDPTVPA